MNINKGKHIIILIIAAVLLICIILIMYSEFNSLFNRKISVNKAEKILSIDFPKNTVMVSSTTRKIDDKYKPYVYKFVLTIPGDALTDFIDYIKQNNFGDKSDVIDYNCEGMVTARKIIGHDIDKVFLREGNACKDDTAIIPLITTIYVAENDSGDGILYVTYY